jgi:hypothetical protein
MSHQSRPDPPVDPSDATVTTSERSSRVSRRSVLRGAAGASAVGLVTAAGLGQALAAPLPASRSRSATPAANAGASSGPIVVYLRDAAAGELEVFAGSSQVLIHDPAMVARLTRAVR